MSSDEHPSFLVVIIDAKGSAWKNQDQLASDLKIRKEDFIKSLLIFLNSYILLNRRNHLLVISRNSYSSKTVFPPLELSSSSKQEFIPTPDVVMRSIIESVFEESSSSVGRKSSIAQALSKAMCVLNRNLTERPQLQGRVLVAQISSDLADTYNQMMNSIFSAQKMGVPIDSLILSPGESSFLQQASLITGGVYLRPKDQRAVTQLLLNHYLPSTNSRKILVTPTQRNVDFRASCFCHQNPVEFAFMCSVCLALTCSVATDEACSTCGSKRSRAGELLSRS